MKSLCRIPHACGFFSHRGCVAGAHGNHKACCGALFQEATKELEVEGSRSYHSSVLLSQRYKSSQNICFTVRVKIITGSPVILETLFPENYRYRYRLEIRMNYHCRYRLGPRSRPLIFIDSQLPSRKSFELISSNYRYRYRLEMFLN